MSDEQDKLELKVEQAEAAVARAHKAYDEAEPGSYKDSCLQLLLAENALLLAEKKALEQLREKDLLQQRAAAGVGDKCSYSLSCSCRAGNNSLLALSVALGIPSLPPPLPCINAASQPLLWQPSLWLEDWGAVCLQLGET